MTVLRAFLPRFDVRLLAFSFLCVCVCVHSRGRSMSLDDTNKNKTPKKIRGRAVHFNHTVQAVLVPSCRDFDAATSHAIWWDREDEMQFKCAAHLFIQKHGRLTDATEEELLEQGGPPPGMPPLLSLSR